MPDAVPRARQSAWQRWELASLGANAPVAVDPEVVARDALALETASLDAQARAQAHAEGYAAGLAEARNETARLAAVLATMTDHAGHHEQKLADEVLDFALVFARQLVGEALAVRREFIVPIVAAALRQLPQSTQRVELRLNPADIALVRERLANETDAPRLALVADPSVAPGGCRLETEQASVDATPSARWRRLLAGLGRSDDWLEPL